MDVKTYELMLGEVKVTVEVPDGMPAVALNFTVQPMSSMEFERAADMLAGGIAGLRLPEHMRYGYHTPAYTEDVVEVDGWTLRGMIYPPPEMTVAGTEEAPPQPPHTFFGPLRGRVASDAVRNAPNPGGIAGGAMDGTFDSGQGV